MTHSSSILLIGVGNALRGDDAVGLLVLRRIKARALEGVHAVESSGEAGSLIDLWQNANRVVVIDAVSSGAEPGTIFRWDVHHDPLPSKFSPAISHSFGLVQAIGLSNALQQMPSQMIVYGIEGKNFSFSESMSLELESAIAKIIPRLFVEIASMQMQFKS